MILFLSLFLNITPVQNLTWYEYYERGEKQFKKGDNQACIADMLAALELKPESAKNQFTRAVQKIDYKPFYYLALAYHNQKEAAEAYQYAQKAFEGEVIKDEPALQNDLGPILEAYRNWVNTFHQRYQNEQAIISQRSDLINLISQSRFAEAQRRLDGIEDKAPFADIQQQLQLGSRIANQSNSINTDLKNRIDALVSQGNYTTARQLFQTFRDKLPRSMQDDIQAQLDKAPPKETPTKEVIPEPRTVEPTPEQRSDNAELLEFRKRWSAMEQERNTLSDQLTNLSKTNEELQARLDQQQQEQTDTDPPSILLSLKQLDEHIEITARIVTVMDLKSIRYTWNGQDYTPSTADSQRSLNQHTYSFKHPLSYGTNALSITVIDNLDRKTEASESLTVPRPFYLYYQLWVALVLALLIFMISRLLVAQRRRKMAALRHFNPYIAGSPVRDDVMFYGRDDLMKRIQGLVHKNSFMIHGARRIGKTSMLHQLRQNLSHIESQEYRFFPVFIDLQGIREDDLFHHMMAEIHAQADLWDIELADLTYDEDDHKYQARQFSKDIKRIIQRLSDAHHQHIQLVLLMDEVDVLNEFHEKVNQKLRGIFMKDYAEHLTCVMAGIHLKKEWDSSGSPWYNFFEQIPVTAFDKEHARALVLDPVKGIFQYQPEAVELIIEDTSYHPYLIQKVCVSLIDTMLREGRYKITVQHARTALDNLDAEIQRNKHELHHQQMG